MSAFTAAVDSSKTAADSPVQDARRSLFGFLRIVLGVLLLVTAGLKAYELATAPVAEDGLLTSRWLLIGVVEAEFFLGVWLLGDRRVKRTRFGGLIGA